MRLSKKEKIEIRKHLELAKTTLMQQGICFSIGIRTSQGIPITFEKKHLPENIKSSTFDTSTTLSTQRYPRIDEVNEANELDFVSYRKSGDFSALGKRLPKRIRLLSRRVLSRLTFA